MFDKDLFLSLCDKYDVKFSDTENEPIICEHDKKLVQHIKMDIPGFPKQGLYCYGEASFESNQVMQEPLEKLYKYENQPDMREKVKEYISELDKEIERCEELYEEVSVDYSDPTRSLAIQCRIETLSQIKSDLKSRLEELI